MSQNPKPLLLHETEVALQDARTRLTTFRRGLSEAHTNLEKVKETLQDSRLMVVKYKEIYRECITQDLVSLDEIRKLKDIYERNLDMLITSQIENQTLVKYIKDLKHAILEVEGKIESLSTEKGAWNQILRFPLCQPTPNT